MNNADALSKLPVDQRERLLPRLSQKEVWLPEKGVRVALIRWMMTEWCNYRCPYCRQTHERRADKGEGMTAHAFDNFPVDEWKHAFDRHFSDHIVSMVITGGEPMVDRKNMGNMLAFLTAKPNVKCLRIDTNAWWTPEQFPNVDTSKIILMCTFHPSQIAEDVFKNRLTSFLKAGFRIGMVNYVMDQANIEEFERRREEFDHIGVVLHPNPLFDSFGTYSDSELEMMKSCLPPVDFEYRTGISSPFEKPCAFPAVAYEMDYKGRIVVGCHSHISNLCGSFFDANLPVRPVASVSCPHHSCVCLDKYSFIEGVERNKSFDPLAEYSAALKQKLLTNR